MGGQGRNVCQLPCEWWMVAWVRGMDGGCGAGQALPGLRRRPQPGPWNPDDLSSVEAFDPQQNRREPVAPMIVHGSKAGPVHAPRKNPDIVEVWK